MNETEKKLKQAEEKLAHIRELNNAKTRRYRAKYNFRRFSVQITSERFESLDKKLQELDMTKKQFLENAIDSLLKG